MILFGANTEKYHLSYISIYQSITNIFKAKNDTLILFFQKTLTGKGLVSKVNYVSCHLEAEHQDEEQHNRHNTELANLEYIYRSRFHISRLFI